MNLIKLNVLFLILPLIIANKRVRRDAAQIKGTDPQSQDDQDVADDCFKPGPCDPNAKYRTIDGSCNNLNEPGWGMTNTAAVRLRPGVYSDGKKLPRRAKSGRELPNARLVREKLIMDKAKRLEDTRYWTLLAGWGQFISHDTAHSVPKLEGIECCSKEGKLIEPFSNLCMPIIVPRNDSFYPKLGAECINMVRGKTTDDLGCPLTPVQHIVDLTHFIDASPIYGSNKTVADSLRTFQKGQLRYQTFENRMFPPQHPQAKSECFLKPNEPEVCYIGGDFRINQNSLITSIQVILLRLHNEIALELSTINPFWKDETLYQESRRIVIGIVQWITYNEFLPILIGKDFMEENGIDVAEEGLEDTYDITTNPSTLNEFQTAAYRSLHTIVTRKIRLTSRTKKSADIELVEWMNRPSVVHKNLDLVLRGEQTQFIEPFDTNEPFSINNLLFKGDLPFGIDLESISIQRQRDYGMPGYNDFRNYTRKLKRARSFDDLQDAINRKDIERLKSVYDHVDDIDLFVGGLYERPVKDSLFGYTFRNIIGEQFYRWKDGDRFFFTFKNQPGSLTLAQVDEIRKTSSGWLFCVGSNNIGSVHPNNMNNDLKGNEEVPCSSLPALDLTKWKEVDSKYYNYRYDGYY